MRFREEVERLRTMTHPRVAGLFGVVSKAPYYIVTELSINGDLKSFLHTSSDKEDFDGKPAYVREQGREGDGGGKEREGPREGGMRGYHVKSLLFIFC